MTCEAQTVSVTAILSDGSIHDTYGGTISLSTSTALGDWVVISGATDLLVSAITPAGGSAGAFAPGNLAAGAFSGGVATVPSASYAETVSIVLRASSLDYLGEPAADILGFSPEIGRFYPDRFELLLDDVSASCTVGASSYTYMDEPALGIDYRLLARNALGQTTHNYDSALGYAAGQVRYHAEDSDDGVDLSARVSAGAGSWELGSYVRPSATAGYTASDARFSRAATEDGPYQALQIGLSVFGEPDGRNLSLLDMDPATAGDCVAAGTCIAAMVGSPTEVRFGRLRVLGAYGPETVNLPVPILTEYFNGTRIRAQHGRRKRRYRLHTPASLSGRPADRYGARDTHPGGLGHLHRHDELHHRHGLLFLIGRRCADIVGSRGRQYGGNHRGRGSDNAPLAAV